MSASRTVVVYHLAFVIPDHVGLAVTGFGVEKRASMLDPEFRTLLRRMFSFGAGMFQKGFIPADVAQNPDKERSGEPERATG